MSDASALPADVETLLRRRIRSLTQLDVLLLLRGAPRTAADVAGALRISEEHAHAELEALVKTRLARRQGGVFRAVEEGRLQQTLDSLADLYPRYRVAVAAAIFSELRARRRRSASAD